MMTFHVAYPDELLNDTEVDAYYQSFELTGGNYLESISNLTLFMILKEYSSLRLPVDKDKWTVYGEAATSNAMNKLSYNAISNYILIDNAFRCIMIFNVLTSIFVQYCTLLFFKVFDSTAIDQGT